MHWDLRQSEQSSDITKTLSASFDKNKHKSNPLFKALTDTTKGIKNA